MLIKNIFAGLVIAVLAAVPGFAANQPGAVVQLANAAVLASSDYSNTPQISLSGYYTANDGGEGIFVKTTCTPDGGACLADNAGNHYLRTNLNGKLAQYGITLGSAYDWSVHGVSATDATPIIEAAQTANALAGVPTTHCGAMQIYLATNLVLAANSSFTCDVNPGITNDSTGYVSLPGTIRLAHGVTITRAGDSSAFYGAYVLPYWYTTALSSAQTGFAALTSMVSNGDTGVICNQQSCGDHDLTILGFDTGYEYINAPNLVTNNINIDANVCLWADTTGGNSNNQNMVCFPYLTRSVPTTKRKQIFTLGKIENDGGLCKVTVTPSSTGSDLADLAYANYIYIANLTNTSASCNGQWVMSNLNTGAGTFDLVGSAALGPSAYSHWAAGTKIVYTASDTNIAAGNVINGLDAQGIPTGTTVAYVWNLPYHSAGYVASTGSANAYALDQGAIAPCTLDSGQDVYWQPNFSNTAAATFNLTLNSGTGCTGGTTGPYSILRADGTALQANDIISGAHLYMKYDGTTHWLLQQPKVVLSANTTLAQTAPISVTYTNAVCSSCGINAQAEFTVASRVDAGGSAGGIAAGGTGNATGVHVGGPAAKGLPVSDKVAGFTCTDCFVYDHTMFFHVENSNETKLQDIRTDSEGSTDNANQYILVADGQVNNIHWNGIKAAKGGTALLININYPNNSDRGCVTWTGASVASTAGTYPVVDVEQGCWRMLNGVANSNGVNFIANNALQARFDVYMPNTTMIYEGADAEAATCTVGSVLAGGYVCPTLTGPATTYSTLPVCTSAIKGQRAFITDADNTAFLFPVLGGGAFNVPVLCDGTNWVVG